MCAGHSANVGVDVVSAQVSIKLYANESLIWDRDPYLKLYVGASCVINVPLPTVNKAVSDVRLD